MVDVVLQPCLARKVFKPLMIEGDGGVDVGLPTLFFLEKSAELTHEKRQGKIEAYEFMKVEGMADRFSHAFDDY